MPGKAEQTAQSKQPEATRPRIALRLRLASGLCSIPLHRVHHLAGYATLSGRPDDYFLGWLMFHGQQVPVVDLNRIVCDQPTPEHFASRIILIETPGSTPVSFIGLLAGGVTDTIAQAAPDAPTLDLDSYLPMIHALIPAPPAGDAHA